MVELTETTIAMTFAILGVVFTFAWLVLGLYGLSTLRDIRNAMAGNDGAGG